MWKGPSAANPSGDFNDAANWSTGKVPTAGFGTEPLLAGTSSYTVTSTQNNNVDGLLIRDTNAALAIAAGSFESLGTVVNAGTITVAINATLEFAGFLDNTGEISLQASFQGAGQLVFADAPNHVLNGGGTITMGNGSQIVSDGSATRLVNDDTIKGSGTIGDATTTLVNNGTIDAVGPDPD